MNNSRDREQRPKTSERERGIAARYKGRGRRKSCDKERRDSARWKRESDKEKKEIERKVKRANTRKKWSPRKDVKREKRGERERWGAGLRHAGSMPTNYECKVMVILISSAGRKKMAVIKPRTVFSSLPSRFPFASSVFDHPPFSRSRTLFRTFSHICTWSAPIARDVIETQYMSTRAKSSRGSFRSHLCAQRGFAHGWSSRCNHDGNFRGMHLWLDSRLLIVVNNRKLTGNQSAPM